MATAMIGTALSVVRTALSPFTDSLLEMWAASKDLGSNVRALELELLAVQALLEHTVGKEIVDNSALKKLLVILQDLGYDAEDVLDELEYFRIQDELEGTFNAADEHAKGATHNLALNVRHTAKAVGKMISLPSSCFSATPPGTKGKAHSNSPISSARHTNQANRGTNGWKAKLTSTNVGCNPIRAVDDLLKYGSCSLVCTLTRASSAINGSVFPCFLDMRKYDCSTSSLLDKAFQFCLTGHYSEIEIAKDSASLIK